MSAAVLPPLRQDLRLNEAAPESDGSPAWVIEDPVVNRFYRIGWLEFECLLRWGQPVGTMIEDIRAQTPLQVEPEQVAGLARFLEQNQLVYPSAPAVARLAARSTGNQWLQWKWWVHHYLFFRVPLVRPQNWLAAAEPYVRWLYTPLTAWLVAGLGVMGLVLTGRQWDVFQQTLVESVSPEGLAGFLLALAFAKTAHELGHAFTATHYGVRVAHMGVAFLVLWPMLYTDTGESWRLRSRYQRLAVAAAGITTELAIAAVATLGWALVEPGTLRNALFYLATTGWVLSLALNISPFMRFDGYFILSDWLDMPNMHERSGALARAWMRRTLLGWDEPDPEDFSPATARLLRAFAITTWIYRLVIFLGIAVLVYFLFFKVLGIILFAVEIIWFVARPVWSELAVWRKRSGEIRTSRRRFFWLTCLVLGTAALVPWKSEVRGPAVVRPERQVLVYAPFPAQLATVHNPGPVKAGELLAAFDAPEVSSRGLRADIGARALEQRLTGLEADDKGLEQRNATQQRLNEQIAESRAASGELGRLRLTAGFDGIWMDLDPQLRSGAWVGTREPLGALIDPAQWEADAYIEHRQVERLAAGDSALFYPEGQTTPLKGRVIDVDPARVQRLPHAMLSNRYGGPIAVAPRSNDLIPLEPRYRVRVRLETRPPDLRETRGQVVIHGQRRSAALEALTSVMAVLVRESGF